ncbi:MAG: nitrate reductase molybdenum cofactor assembly chaperone [Legionellales bacterium]|nr:nitrate reductase molybdenum cofactor assembly chaperone [Legionellales bacterium]
MKNQNNPLRTFKVLSLLLSYPSAVWISEMDALLKCIESEGQVSPVALSELRSFASSCQTEDLLQLETEYVATFDQQRTLSLHLFEHLHGDSRDRGQAMVDLSMVYQEHHLLIEAKELPDYLPLFLECLSVIPAHTAFDLLQECLPIIERIASGLASRGNRYTAVFNTLLSVGKKPIIPWILTLQPEADPTAADRLDKEWEEEEIKFLGNSCVKDKGACGEVTTHSVKITKNPHALHGE